MRLSCRDSIRPLGLSQRPAGARIERTFRSMGGVGDARDFFVDVATGAEAGIEDSALAELSEGALVGAKAVRLANRIIVPGDSQPTQVLLDALVILRPDTGVIDVLEAQEKAALLPPGQIVRHQCSVGVAEVETAGWAGREARGHTRVLTVGVPRNRRKLQQSQGSVESELQQRTFACQFDAVVRNRVNSIESSGGGKRWPIARPRGITRT